jgi:hypothetical protein
MATVPAPPLAVDLDGTLARTDTLWETLFVLAREQSLGLISALFSLRHGRAAFKARLVALAPPEVATLPLNAELIAWLRDEKAAGRTLVLATATDRHFAQAVADRVGLFDQVLASDGQHNLKGAHKARAKPPSHLSPFQNNPLRVQMDKTRHIRYNSGDLGPTRVAICTFARSPYVPLMAPLMRRASRR